MFSFGSATFLAAVEVLGPRRKRDSSRVMNSRVIAMQHDAKIFGSIVQSILVVVVNCISIWDRADKLFSHAAMFWYPSRFGFPISIDIATFAMPDSQSANSKLIGPAFAKFPPINRPAYWRTGHAAQWSLAFKRLAADGTNSEVLSHCH
jgi:hypothetical protein